MASSAALLLEQKGALIITVAKPGESLVVCLGCGVHGSRTAWNGSDQDLYLLAEVASIAELHLDCTIKDQRALRFLTKMRSLRRLIDSGNTIKDDGMRFVGRCEHLEEFEALSTITDEGLHQAMSLKHLRKLKLFCPNVTDNGVQGVETLSNIEMLELIDSQITDSGLRNIVKLPKLRELNLSGTSISDAGVPYLTKCHELRKLAVVGTKITASGISSLKARLPKCEIESSKNEPNSK